MATTIAYCEVRYFPKEVTGVRATITSRHSGHPGDSMTTHGLAR